MELCPFGVRGVGDSYDCFWHWRIRTGRASGSVDLEGVVGMAAFLALFRRYLRGNRSVLDRILLIGFVILRLG